MDAAVAPGLRGTAKIQRVINSIAVLDLVVSGQRTVTQLADHTGLSRTAAKAVAKRLVDVGWLTEDTLEPHGRGRPARGFSLRPGLGLVAGLDLGPHTMRLSLADLSGTTVWHQEHSVTPELDSAIRLRLVSDLFERGLESSGTNRDDVWVIAVGAPGIVADGVVTHCGPIPDLVGVDLTRELSELLRRPVLVENDCNLAAIGERWQGVAQGVADLAYVLAGERIGSGLVIRGELLRGHHGGAGETGALAELEWLTAHEILTSTDGAPQQTTAEIFAAGVAGDPEAKAAIERYSAALATGIAALVLTVDPELVVVGGGLSSAGEQLLRPLAHYVDEKCHTRPVDIRFSELGARGVVVGALRMALDAFHSALARVSYQIEELPTPKDAFLAHSLTDPSPI